MRHLIDPMDLSVEEVDHLLVLAQDIIDNKENAPDAEVAVALGHGHRAGLAGGLCFGRVAQDLASRLP